MRGTLATLLLMVPVLSIPALAIFGIPQFTPMVASPLDEEPEDEDRERRVGKSERHDDDMVSEFGHAPDFDSDSQEPRSKGGRVGESVPLRRPGQRSGRDTTAEGFDRRYSATNPPRSSNSWQDDSAGDLQQPREFEGKARGHQTTDVNDGQLRDLRFDSRQAPPSFGGARIQNASITDPAKTTDARQLPRTRDRLPETGNSVRVPSVQTDPLSLQGAIRRLNELDIRNFRLQPGSRENEFVFACNYSPADTPLVSYRFEAEADEPVKAIEKTLDKIAEWQQQRR
jgi:hypothetical protein